MTFPTAHTASRELVALKASSAVTVLNSVSNGTDRDRGATARELRDAGLTYRAIGAQLGCGKSTVLRLLNPTVNEESRRASLAAKKRRTGVCVDCFKPTSYNGSTVNGPSALCPACSAHRLGLKRRGTGPRGREMLDFLREPRTVSDARAHLGITVAHTSVLLNRLKKYGLARQVRRGVWVAVDSRPLGEAAQATERAEASGG